MLVRCTGSLGRCGAAIPGGLLFLLLHCQADGIQDQTCGLRFCRFISCDAVIVKVPDHGQIEDTLAGVNVRDICDPFGVRSVCMEIPVEQVFISMDLLSHIDPLPGAADFCQQVIFLHDSQHCFRVMMDSLFPQPYPHPPVTVGLPAMLLLLPNQLTQRLRQVCLTDGQSHNNRFWTHQMPYT